MPNDACSNMLVSHVRLRWKSTNHSGAGGQGNVVQAVGEGRTEMCRIRRPATGVSIRRCRECTLRMKVIIGLYIAYRALRAYRLLIIKSRRPNAIYKALCACCTVIGLYRLAFNILS